MPVRTRDKRRVPMSSPAPYVNSQDEEAALFVNEIVRNQIYSRYDLINRWLDPRRNIDDECGYPETRNITLDNYKRFYDREDAAARVNDLLPDECWQVSPEVFEDENTETETQFEAAVLGLSKSLFGSKFFDQDEGSPIWEFLHRADRLSGIAHYGAIFFGLDDGKELSQPVSPREGMELTHVRVFDQSSAEIVQFEQDKTNRRYTLPKMYQVTFHDPADQATDFAGVPTRTEQVHWSRILHVADNLETNEIYGVPRMRPVYNRLMDLRKLYGGGAEGYWRGAFPGLSFEGNPDGIKNAKVNTKAIRQAAERYVNTLQRFLITQGVNVKSLAPQVVDFSSQVDSIITAICVKLGVPKRIFMGSERGELASSQDSRTWNKRVKRRQRMYLTPRLIVPFFDRLIRLGVLPEPTEGFKVRWPDVNEMTDQDKAQLASQRTEAMAKYVGSGLDVLMNPLDWMVREMGIERDDAEEILKNTLEHLRQVNPDTPSQQIKVPGRNPKPPELVQPAEGPQGGRGQPFEGNGKGKPFNGKPPQKGPQVRHTVIVNRVVKLKSGRYRVVSKTGKSLGEFDTKKEANKRLQQVEYFKHKKKARNVSAVNAGGGCGTGAGGFKPGNTCARKGGHAVAKSAAPVQKDTAASKRAKRHHVPSTREMQDASRVMEQTIAKALGAKWLDDNEPMDNVIGGKVGLEIKVLHRGRQNRVQMRKSSRQRKTAWARKAGRTAHTVLIDNRNKFEGGKHRDYYSGHRIYYSKGVGAFRLGSMTKVKNMAELKRLIKENS